MRPGPDRLARASSSSASSSALSRGAGFHVGGEPADCGRDADQGLGLLPKWPNRVSVKLYVTVPCVAVSHAAVQHGRNGLVWSMSFYQTIIIMDGWEGMVLLRFAYIIICIPSWLVYEMWLGGIRAGEPSRCGVMTARVASAHYF